MVGVSEREGKPLGYGFFSGMELSTQRNTKNMMEFTENPWSSDGRLGVYMHSVLVLGFLQHYWSNDDRY